MSHNVRLNNMAICRMRFKWTIMVYVSLCYDNEYGYMFHYIQPIFYVLSQIIHVSGSISSQLLLFFSIRWTSLEQKTWNTKIYILVLSQTEYTTLRWNLEWISATSLYHPCDCLHWTKIMKSLSIEKAENAKYFISRFI